MRQEDVLAGRKEFKEVPIDARASRLHHGKAMNDFVLHTHTAASLSS